MSDENVENVEDVFDGVIENSADPELDGMGDGEYEKGSYKSPTHEEVTGYPRGYMTKDAWVEAGRDPEDWVSPEVFKERGERIKMKADFENRLKNINMFHQKQMDILREELMNRRDEAIDTADKAAVKKIDKELKELDDIEQLNRQEEAQKIVKPPEVVEWEEENPWCNNPADPRLALAQRVYKTAVESGKTPATALRMVDRELAAKFIDTSRKPAQIAESSRPSSGKANDGKPTMANLTGEEKKIWESGIFDSKDDFLKAVADSRKAGKK